MLSTQDAGSRSTVYHLPCPETIKREARAEHVQEQELRHVKGAQEERTGTHVNDGDPADSGENRVSSHTSLHTNLPISVRKCARGTRTGSRQRGFSGVEDLTSYPEMYGQPGGVHRASVVWVLLHRVHREHLLEHL